MSLKQRIETDVKTAMLDGDREVAGVLRDLRSAILNEEIAAGQRESGLGDAGVEKVVAREVKKRDEAADLYEKGGNNIAAGKERAEKEILSGYLPKQLGDDELAKIVQEEVKNAGDNPQTGKIIGAVKQKVGNQADGARVAAAVQRALKS